MQHALGANPWQVRDKYIENSPLFYSDRFKTPLIIVHLANDDTVASFFADLTFVALRRLGRDVESAKYDGKVAGRRYNR